MQIFFVYWLIGFPLDGNPDISLICSCLRAETDELIWACTGAFFYLWMIFAQRPKWQDLPFSLWLIGDTRPSFSPRTCELCSQEMDCLIVNFTKYFKRINKFDLFLSFCKWEVLGISANLNFWMYFLLIKAANFYKIPQEIWLTLSRFTGRQEKKTPWPPEPLGSYLYLIAG